MNTTCPHAATPEVETVHLYMAADGFRSEVGGVTASRMRYENSRHMNR